MWNRLRHVSWIFVILLFLASGTGIAHAEQLPAHTSSTAARTDTDFSKFAGTWTAHGAFMIVSPDGHVRFEARTYNWCTANSAQPCDSIENDRITYGYYEQLVLSRVNDGIAYGTVVTSNDRQSPRTAITLALGPANTLIYAGNGTLTFLCGPQAPAGTCGA